MVPKVNAVAAFWDVYGILDTMERELVSNTSPGVERLAGLPELQNLAEEVASVG